MAEEKNKKDTTIEETNESSKVEDAQAETAQAETYRVISPGRMVAKRFLRSKLSIVGMCI